MAEDSLDVSLVSATSELWSGRASFVTARTVSGDIGILPGHVPVLSLLEAGRVTITSEGTEYVAAVDSGVLSVAADQVRLLCENAQISADGDYESLRSKLQEQSAEEERRG